MEPSGTPQDTNLGPLLFIMYTNDLPLHHCTKPFLYADDTVLVARGSLVAEIEQKLNNDLNTTRKWLDANKLSLNLAKTKVVLFSHPRNSTFSNCNLNVMADNTLIEQVSVFKYLGLMLDQHLSFMDHCDMICESIRGLASCAGT